MPVSELVKEYSLDEALDTIRKNGKVLSKYNNFIGGKWVAPVKGRYFVDHSPINGEPIAEIAKSTPEDVEKALDAAHAAKDAWGHASPAARAAILNKIADVMEENLEVLAIAETIDNGKPIRETRNADVPLSIDHFRYFASCIRAEEGALGEIDNDTVAYHVKEPLGVVGQIIPWNFPLLMAAWKLAPAVGAGNCTVIKPASNTPLSLLVLMGLIGDILPPGVWSRNGTNCYRVGREIKAGRVWTNCYHLYPAGAAFGGYKQSGFGRETHKIILEHYQQTKNLLVSYSPKALGFF